MSYQAHTIEGEWLLGSRTKRKPRIERKKTQVQDKTSKILKTTQPEEGEASDKEFDLRDDTL